jgi:hypothetical protein
VRVADSNIDADRFRDCDCDCDSDMDLYSYADFYRDLYPHKYPALHVNTAADKYSITDSELHGNQYAHSDGNIDSESYGDARPYRNSHNASDFGSDWRRCSRRYAYPSEWSADSGAGDGLFRASRAAAGVGKRT